MSVEMELFQILPQLCYDSSHIPTVSPCIAKCSVLFTVPLAREETVESLEWTWVEFTVDETVDVVVCVMYSPGEFYCHFLKDDGKGILVVYVLSSV